MTGGKKGHMHWFYSSLMFQQFVCLLIGGDIGFWEVGLALWYLVTLPMAPIIVFIYQLMIHSWIRNNGPRYPEYIVVEYQIWLAICLSCIAAVFWILGYVIPYEGATLDNLATLDNKNPASSNITVGAAEIKVAENSGGNGTITLTSKTLKPKVPGKSVTVPITVIARVKPGQSSNYDVTVTATITSLTKGKITVYNKVYSVTVYNKVYSVTVYNKVYSVTVYNKVYSVTVYNKVYSVTVSASGNKITLESEGNKITVKAEGTGQRSATVNSNETGTVTINKGAGVDQLSGLTDATYTYKTFTPNHGHYISSVKGPAKGSQTPLWDTQWDGGECEYAEYYERKTGGGSNTIPALAIVYVRIIGGLDIRYFGTSNTGSTTGQWQIINADKFYEELYKLRGTNNLTGLGTEQPPNAEHNLVKGTRTDQYNTNYKQAITDCEWEFNDLSTWKFTPVKYPLIMQGLSVGAVGSIFPNLIPKTLVYPKTTRTLTVVNMFLVTVPHIINLALADNGWPSWSPGTKWDENWGWPLSWSLYIFYIMAFLFAVFNVHYPEWRLCYWIRNHTWFIFLMTLFTNVLNEVFNAISRGGIMTQRSANNGPKNHPCLYNKIACLMNLTYIPFW